MVLSEFSPTWFEGTAASSETPTVYPVAIAGHGYLIEPKLYRRSFVPVQRDTRDDSAEPGEQTLSPAGLWRRSQSDWTLGAGQEWLDEAESTRRRFRTSLGVDVFTERQACLLPVTEEKRTSANSNLRLLVVGTRLYVVDGVNVLFSNGSGSEQNGTWTTGWTTATGLPASAVLDIAFSGSHVYVLGGDNSIYRATPGTTAFTLWYNPVAVTTRLWSALGRLFASDGRVLYEINATPGESTILTHPSPEMVWSALVGTPTGVYVAGNIGSLGGEIRHFAVDDTGAAFTVPAVSAEFRNESVHSLAAAGNNLLIGTLSGFRYAPISLDGSGLDYGPVVTVGPVRDIVLDTIESETFAWFTWSAIETGVSGAGRIRVARFTEPRVAAYASDIYTEDTGGSVLAVASLAGRRYFAVSGEGFYGATVNYVEEGTIATGRIRYGMLDRKVFSDLQWHTDPLPEGASVFVTATFDTGQIVVTDAQTAPTSVESAMISLGPVTGEWVELVWTLRRGGVQTNALMLDAFETDLADTPDHLSFAITDLDVRVHLAMDSWAPGGFGVFVMSQRGASSDVAWHFGVTAAGHLSVAWSPDGTTGSIITFTSATALPFLPGSDHRIRATIDVNDGAGNRVVTLYTSEDGVTWTVFDTVTTAGVTSIFNSTANLAVSAILPFSGYVLSAELLASIGGAAVANPNFGGQPVGTTSFNDGAGRTWTLSANAEIALVEGSQALSPCVRAWVLRSIPAPQSTQRFLVPIRLTHKVRVPWGPVREIHADEELEFIGSLVQTQQIVKYQEGHYGYDVHVVNYEVQGTDWDPNGHHMESIVIVELHSLR